MLKHKALVIILSMFILTAPPLISQEDVLRPKGKPGHDYSQDEKYSSANPLTLGINSGLNYCMFNSDMVWSKPGINSPFAAFQSGNGFAPYFDIFADYSITNTLGLQFTLAYDMKDFSHSNTGLVNCVDFSTVPYSLINANARLDIKYEVIGSYIDIGLALRANITPEFFVLAGPLVQFKSGTFKMKVDEHSLDQGCYIDYSTQTVSAHYEYNLDLINNNFGINLGAGYKFSLSPKVWLVPQIRIQYILSKFGDDEISNADPWRPLTDPNLYFDFTNKHLHSLQLMVGVWFDL